LVCDSIHRSCVTGARLGYRPGSFGRIFTGSYSLPPSLVAIWSFRILHDKSLEPHLPLQAINGAVASHVRAPRLPSSAMAATPTEPVLRSPPPPTDAFRSCTSTTRAITASNRATLPRPSPEHWPQQTPLPGGAARFAAGRPNHNSGANRPLANPSPFQHSLRPTPPLEFARIRPAPPPTSPWTALQERCSYRGLLCKERTYL
jgi:hypothetical protein